MRAAAQVLRQQRDGQLQPDGGDDGVRHQEDRLLLVRHRVRKARVLAARREPPDGQVHKPVRQDQVLHGGDHEGCVHSQSGNNTHLSICLQKQNVV